MGDCFIATSVYCCIVELFLEVIICAMQRLHCIRAYRFRRLVPDDRLGEARNVLVNLKNWGRGEITGFNVNEECNWCVLCDSF
jgi:hypothetical protein